MRAVLSLRCRKRITENCKTAMISLISTRGKSMSAGTSTFLLSWNPKVWNWKNIQDVHARLASGETYYDEWRVLNRNVKSGDRIFLIKLGSPPTGVFAAGFAVGSPEFKVDSSIDEIARWYLPIRLTALIDPSTEVLISQHELRTLIPTQHNWSPRPSGIRVASSDAEKLERLWSRKLGPTESAEEDIRTLALRSAGGLPTDYDALVKARRGQGKFRRDLLHYWNDRCAVTGLSQPALLRASHIKKWSKSTDEERLDPFNGLLLAAHLDLAFELRFITFEDSGRIRVSSRLTANDRLLLGIHPEMTLRRIDAKHRGYLSVHQKELDA